jgi:hypothetical protein
MTQTSAVAYTLGSNILLLCGVVQVQILVLEPQLPSPMETETYITTITNSHNLFHPPIPKPKCSCHPSQPKRKSTARQNASRLFRLQQRRSPQHHILLVSPYLRHQPLLHSLSLMSARNIPLRGLYVGSRALGSLGQEGKRETWARSSPVEKLLSHEWGVIVIRLCPRTLLVCTSASIHVTILMWFCECHYVVLIAVFLDVGSR